MEMGQCIYKQYDADQSGTIGSNELPGLWLNKQLYQMIVCRYSDEKGKQDFDNFISCLVLLDTLFRSLCYKTTMPFPVQHDLQI
ncbi:calpain small subunit 1-like isoform X5 [Carettochelys insculpta]|uniref:calpain small subunit 1-like isoform X5 n=1 Tax=Carettochelys insculpta TaxID=44489 RepID=UPI003EBE2222